MPLRLISLVRLAPDYRGPSANANPDTLLTAIGATSIESGFENRSRAEPSTGLHGHPRIDVGGSDPTRTESAGGYR